MVGMSEFKVGDIVARKSYGCDVYFKIVDISSRNDGKKACILRGLLYRILADSNVEDLIWQNPTQVRQELQRNLRDSGMYGLERGMTNPFNIFNRFRGRPGKILHIDSSSDFLNMCLKFYREAKITAYGHVFSESEQPGQVRSLLAGSNADILIITGHDGIKKDSAKLNTPDSYRNSKYYIQSVKEARKYEPSMDKLCIFAGACQSYYEGIMGAGANFASSPGRILIHALDPAKVGDRVALTDSREYVTPERIASITQSGSKGIWGIRTKGHYNFS
jgi:spore coat assembly protein